MTALKIAGVLLISGTFFGMGISYCRALTYELDIIRGFTSLVKMIKTRIECYCQPLPEIYRDFSYKSLDELGFTKELRESGFEFAYSKYKDVIADSEQAQRALGELGRELGKTPSTDQLEVCRRCLDILYDVERGLDSELPQRKKLSTALCLMAGLMTVILFI